MSGVERALAGLAVARVVLGSAGLLAPRSLQRACLFEPSDDPSATTAWRYFGARALALGTGWLGADADGREVLERVGLVVDVTDTAFLSAMVARGSLPAVSAAWMGTTTVAATAIGLLGRRQRSG